MSFTGRTAVVTGGSRGIGRAICLELARRGANVVFSYAGNTAAAEATRKELEALGVQTRAVQGSVADPAAVKTLIDTAVKELGSLDILVNNAGITRDNLAMMLKEEDFDAVIETNLKGAFLTMKAAARPMMKARYGRIVNLSSVVALRGNPGQINYCASKAGLIGMTKSLAKELGGRGVTVNAVAPGYIATDMTAALPDAAREAMLAAIPAGRPGTPEDVAAAVAFSPSLKAAVEHDFIQYIGQSQTDNGITLHLEYLFPDRGQLQFYATVTGPEEFSSFMVHPVLTDESGQPLETYGSTSKSVHPGELSNAFTVFPFGDAAFPETLYLTCEISGHRGGATEPPEPLEGDPSAPYAVVSFRLPLDTALLAQGETLEVDRWINLDGNKLHIQALELYPTHARLLLEEEPTNRESLRGLDFYLADGRGNRYAAGSSGGTVSQGGAYWCESPYFSPDRNLTLCITGAEWLEKGKEYVTVDLETGRALTPLPVDVRVSARRDGDNAEVAFYAPMPPEADEDHLVFRQLGTMDYRAPDGSTVAIYGVTSYHSDVLWQGTSDEIPLPEGWFIENYTIESYLWDTIDMGLHATRETCFETPVSVPLA